MADINNVKDLKWMFMIPHLTRIDNGRQILPAQIRVRNGRVNEERTKARLHEYWHRTDNLRMAHCYDPDDLLGELYTPGRQIY